jgi:cell division protease FtsH
MLLRLVVVLLLSLGGSLAASPSVSSFLSELRSGGVAKVVLSPNGSAQVTTDRKRSTQPDEYRVQVIMDKSLFDALEFARANFNTKYSVSRAIPTGDYIMIGVQVAGVAILIVMLVLLIRSRSGGGAGDGAGGAMSFGKSRAKQVEKPSTSFKEVAGCDEAKEELSEVVDFLKNPTKYHDIGARIPKGVLLIGPPGSGKTLLARAVAGEARVPFFTISGSDFVEMFVGVGAARVRDLFEQARKTAPCIIFIDEIDAVGRKRGSGMGGGNDEREQTLNQLLVEMDGFETKHDIIILAATNRPDVLDSALLRPGRFDRQVTVDAPDVKGREEILRVHSRKKPLDETVDLKTVAKRTPGFVGADLENLLNESALLAARSGRRKINMKDIDEAADRVVMGAARKSRVILLEDKLITAYHEVGHAIAAHLLPLSDKVHKLTIVPRGGAAGYMMPLPSETQHYSKSRLLDEIAVFLAGRCAEELQFADVTTGAQNDFQRATSIAKRMVAEWGMSQTLGHVALIEETQNYLGYGSETRSYSNATAQAIDAEVKSIIEIQYVRVKHLLEQNRNAMDRVVGVLLERETLNGEEFTTVFEGGLLPEETQDPKPNLEPGFSPANLLPKIGGA